MTFCPATPPQLSWLAVAGEGAEGWWARRRSASGEYPQACDEEDVSIDTSYTPRFSHSIFAFSSACPSLRSALKAVVLVVAHLQPQAPPPAHATVRAPELPFVCSHRSHCMT